jgi:hypothetical protein
MTPMKRIMFWVLGVVAVLLIAAYFISGVLIHRKVDEALQNLPSELRVSYTNLRSNIFNGSLSLTGLIVRFSKDKRLYEASIDQVSMDGIRFFELMRAHRLLLRTLRVSGIKAGESESKLLLEGNVELDSVYADVLADTKAVNGGVKEKMAAGKMGFGGIRLSVFRLHYRIPDADEILRLSNLTLDSKNRLFRLDTLRLTPVLEKLKMGEVKGHQVDVVEATSEGIEAKGLDVMGLWKHRLHADRLTVERNRIYVFRDRRLPMESGEKPMPAESLKALPISLRIGSVSLGTTTFSYEEYPKKGDKTGTLTIYRLKGSIEPLINKPEAGDPAYLTMRTEGSLMNSGSVTAVTKIPLHKGDPYRVEGAFHELDVTKLNDPAENLGKLHLESGMLNSLAFWFELSDEKATGKIVGEYHDLVVDKLKENSTDKKVDKLKSFALKKFIIPKDKDRSLPEKKRTGKVDYKRDPQRYFSYYLLHSLLVGVKSSFSLGFLLPG